MFVRIANYFIKVDQARILLLTEQSKIRIETGKIRVIYILKDKWFSIEIKNEASFQMLYEIIVKYHHKSLLRYLKLLYLDDLLSMILEVLFRPQMEWCIFKGST